MNKEQCQALIDRFSEVINADRFRLLEDVLDQRTRHLVVGLDDIYQPQNASAIIRSCECLGIQELYAIEDRNTHKVNRAVVKGASKWIDLHLYRQARGRRNCLDDLKQQGYRIVAMSLSENNLPLEQLPVDDKLALFIGCEETGLDKTIEAAADYHVQIPICGFTQSYNVSVSAGISLYYLTNRIKQALPMQDWQLANEDRQQLLLDWLSKSTPTGENLLNKYKQEMGL